MVKEVGRGVPGPGKPRGGEGGRRPGGGVPKPRRPGDGGGETGEESEDLGGREEGRPGEGSKDLEGLCIQQLSNSNITISNRVFIVIRCTSCTKTYTETSLS